MTRCAIHHYRTPEPKGCNMPELTPAAYVVGYNLRGYSPDPDSLHVVAELDDAREYLADELKRWSDECYEQVTDLPDEQADLESISAELAGDAETVREWINEHGGATATRGPDGNEYTFWAVPKTYAELIADGWDVDELQNAGVESPAS